MSQPLRASICLLAILLLCAAGAAAQTSTSRLTGTVTDTAGAVVPGATVTALNEATGITQTQTTTDAGLYSFASLPVGKYTITVEKSGFKTAKMTGNVLEVNTPLPVDVTLTPGEVAEVVTVQAGAEQIQTSNAAIGNVVEQKAIEALPLNGRNPLTLILLEPGVVQRSQGAAGSGVHVNGSRDRAFNVTIDGIDANESSVPNPVSNLYRLNPDNVQEYKVTTNNATAEEGRNSGAAISVATRSGTNDLHGTAFYFLRNEALNANEFFANAQGLPKPVIRLHQWGFEAGGPIKKNKTFFFGSLQQNKIFYTQAIDQAFGTVPTIYTPTMLSGLYRFVKGTITLPNGQTFTRNSPQLVDRNTGALVAGVRACSGGSDTNCIASYNIFANDPRRTGLDPTVASILNKYPAPNSYAFGDGLNTATFLWNPPSQFKGPAIMARVDHTFNQNNSMFVRWLQSKYDTTRGDFLNSRPQLFPGFPPLGEVFRGTKNLAISWRRVISPRVINEFTTGFSRFNFFFTFGESNPAFPDIPPFNFTNIDEPYLNIPRTQRAVTTPQFLDNVSVTSGAHNYRFGGNVRFYNHVDRRGLPGGSNLAPTVSFSATTRPPVTCSQTVTTNCFPNLSTSALGINSTDFSRLQGAVNDLLGIPSGISENFLGNIADNVFLPFRVGDKTTLHGVKTKLNQYNLYAQDEWKFRPNLTLNYGVRWEINPAPYAVGGNTFVPDKLITTQVNNPVVGQPGAVTFVKSNRWFHRNNVGAVAPSLGLAWSPDWRGGPLRALFGPNGRSVVRLGYRMAFDPISSFQATAVSGKVPGVVTLCSTTISSTTNTISTTPGCTQPAISGVNQRVAEGFPTIMPPPSRQPSSFLTPTLQLLQNSPSLILFDQNFKLPTVHQWSASVQRELPGGFVVQAAYIGRRGLRLMHAYDINQIDADPILPSFVIMQQNVARGCTATGTGCPAGVTGTTPPLLNQLVAGGLTAAQATAFLNGSAVASDLPLNAAGTFAGRVEQTTLALRLRPNQQFGTITYIDSGGNSYYHSAQFTLHRRFASGLGLSLAYTFGKSIDDQSVDPVGASSGGGLSATNSRTPTSIRNWREERARSDFDRRNVFTAASVWDLPVGRGKRFLDTQNGLLNQLFGGWQINGIFTAMSGEPFSVRSGVRTANFSHESRALVTDPNLRARLQNVSNIVGPVVFKDTSGFAIPPPGSNGSGRNIFTGPGYWNLDLGFIKTFAVTERLKLQFRTEMFNALNHPNFDNPRDASVGSPSIRSGAFAQTCCVTVAPASAQAVLPLGESPRVIQFGLKVQF